MDCFTGRVSRVFMSNRVFCPQCKGILWLPESNLKPMESKCVVKKQILDHHSLRPMSVDQVSLLACHHCHHGSYGIMFYVQGDGFALLWEAISSTTFKLMVLPSIAFTFLVIAKGSMISSRQCPKRLYHIPILDIFSHVFEVPACACASSPHFPPPTAYFWGTRLAKWIE
jgi:hypothetical protein